ncbi:unnamed protein product [Choristocarpus tenellus]
MGIALEDDGSVPERVIGTMHERRRGDIKAAKVEKRKEEVENRLMEEEDKRSRIENEAYQRTMRLKLEREQQIAKMLEKMRLEMAAEMAAAAGVGAHSAELMKAMGMMIGSDTGVVAGVEKGSGTTGLDKRVEGDWSKEETEPGPEGCRREYISSSESELSASDLLFAEEMGLPIGNPEVSDSDSEPDSESDSDKVKAKKELKNSVRVIRGGKGRHAVAASTSRVEEGRDRAGGRRPSSALEEGGGRNERSDTCRDKSRPLSAVPTMVAEVSGHGMAQKDLDAKRRVGLENGLQEATVEFVVERTEESTAVKEMGDGREATSLAKGGVIGQSRNKSEDQAKEEQDKPERGRGCRGGEGGQPDGVSTSTESIPSRRGDEVEGSHSSEGENNSSTTLDTEDEKDAESSDSSAEVRGLNQDRDKNECAHQTVGSSAVVVNNPPSRHSIHTKRHKKISKQQGGDTYRKVGAGLQQQQGGKKVFVGKSLGRRQELLVRVDSSDESDTSSDEEEMLLDQSKRATTRNENEAKNARSRKKTPERKRKKRQKREATLATNKDSMDNMDNMGLMDTQKLMLASLKQQKKDIKKQARRKMCRQQWRIIKHLHGAHEIREAKERQIAIKLEQSNQVAQLSLANTELSWMEAEEEARWIEKRCRRENENFRKIDMYCQDKARQELEAREDATKKDNLAKACRKNHDAAAQWRTECIAKEHRLKKWMLHVKKETKFFNGKAFNGQCQRWETDWIHPQLYSRYFKNLVDTIVIRAELIGAERAMMRVHDNLVKMEREIHLKQVLVAKLWKKQKRRELLYLRRSELGRRMFGKSQLAILKEGFQGWLKLHMWLRSMQEAFQLNYSVIKQDLDLDRINSEVDDCNQRTENTTTLHDGKKIPEVRKTFLQRFKERPIVCRNCHCFYLESQNHDLICPYHPGEFTRSCPRNCPGLTEKCMSHRTMQWTCCDSKEPGSWGSSGCKRRCHMPPANGHPELVEMVQKGMDEDKRTLAAMNKELKELSTKDLRHAALKIKKQQIGVIGKKIQKERDIVARFKDLKFS